MIGGVLLGLGLLALVSSSGTTASTSSGTSSETEDNVDRPGRYFTWTELRADGAPPEIREALRELVRTVLDPLRELVGPIRVTSGYRDELRNAEAGGVKGSQHTRGEAVDLVVSGRTSEELAELLSRSSLPFDQAIAYVPSRGGHLHVSHKRTGSNRRELLRAPTGGGYVPWSSSDRIA